MQPLTIYTDGACEPNPGPGGWAYVILWPDGRVEEADGWSAQTTNNRMEIAAAIMALRRVTPGSRCYLFTDSEYLRKGITIWISKWRCNGFRRGRNPDSNPVLNADLWAKLDDLNRSRQVTWRRVPGHSGNRWNERCDDLAMRALIRQDVELASDEADSHENIQLDFLVSSPLS